MKQKMIRWINFIFLFAGFFLVFLICSKIGWGKIFDKITAVQFWQLGIILALPAAWNIMHALAWQIFLEPKKQFSLTTLFRAHIASTAISEIIPMGQAGGESYRLYYLKSKYSGLSPSILASIILYNTAHFFATLTLLAVGIWIIIQLFPVSFTQEILMTSVLVIAFSTVFFFMTLQKKAFLSNIFLFFKKFKIFRSFVERKMHKAQIVDERLNLFYSENKRHFFYSSLMIFASKLIGAFEISLILYFIGEPVSFITTLFIFTGKSLAQILLFFFPSQIGASEGSLFYLFTVLGLNPITGITTALFIRIRTIVWTIIGILIASLTGPKLFQKIQADKEKTAAPLRQEKWMPIIEK